MTEMMERLNDALAGRYRVERELGHGGAAIIYLAHDVKHDRKVALKVLRPELALSIGSDRFLREIKIAAKLSHPHILPVHDSGTAEGFLYYVMPFVEGESLRERIEREGPLDLSDVLAILHDVLDALDHAHSRGVVHRDIKPGNVMLSGRHALVMDFGVAKAVREATQVEEDDSMGVVLGTPTYMAPEQASADPGVDHRADIYAVGAVAYELLAGRPPFPGTTAHALLAAHVSQIPDSITDHRPDIPPMLAHLVMRCLEKDPAHRYQSAEEVLAVLQEVMPGKSIGESLRTAQTARPPTVRRFRWIGFAALATAAALVGAVTLRGPAEAAASGRPVIVVLPFENLGPESDNFFASGVTDAITARLATLGNLGVISRTSAIQYAGRDYTAREIASELGVNYILEGTIQRERPGDPSSRVRIIPQLIRVSDDTHLWANVYDEDLTEVFRVQSEIAERVARALDIALLEPERRLLARRPTENLDAYELYLRGHEYLEGNAGGGDANAMRIAVELFERAISLDGAFALAWAELSFAHIWMYHYFVDPSESRLAMAKAAVDTALVLAPEEPAVHLALGHFYFWGSEPDPQRALDALERVVELEPNNAYAHALIASLEASGGSWDSALENAALAADLDPRDPQWSVTAGGFHLLARQFSDAERYLDRALSLAPDFGEAYMLKIALHLRWRADVDAARAVTGEMLQRVTPGEVALALVRVAPMLVAGGEYDSIFDELMPSSVSGPLPFDYYQLKAEYNRLRGRSEQARTYYDSLLTVVEATPAARATEPLIAMFVGRAYAGLGRRSAAMDQAAHLEDLITGSNDQVVSRVMHESLVWIYAMVGEHDLAVRHLDHLLNTPSLMSLEYLRVANLPGGLREHPGFQELLADKVTPVT